MNRLKEDGSIEEFVCGNNFEYILQDDTNFMDTDFKVLQSKNNDMFIKCMKIIKNGKVDLFYLAEEYRSIASIVNGISPDIFMTIMMDLFSCIIKVQDNGFLSYQRINWEWDKIFIEQNTLKVKLVYIPLNVKMYEVYGEFESDLRSNIVKLLNTSNIKLTERLRQFKIDLSNGLLSLEDIYGKSMQPTSFSVTDGKRMGIKLVAMNTAEYFELSIDKPNILLGKKSDLVDKVIPFNKMISRKHCRIIHRNGHYYIMDEGSANGTFVNGSKLSVGEQIQIKRGDIIRLANSDFQII